MYTLVIKVLNEDFLSTSEKLTVKYCVVTMMCVCRMVSSQYILLCKMD